MYDPAAPDPPIEAQRTMIRQLVSTYGCMYVYVCMYVCMYLFI